MVHFIGAGPGDPELLTIKGKKLIDNADVIIYAGSLVNKEVLAGAKEGAKIYNSATMTLEEVIEHYAEGGQPNPNADPLIRPLDLSEQDRADLLAFLQALTDETVAGNPAWSRPESGVAAP